MQTVSDRLVEVFRDVFEDERLTVTRSTTSADVPGWDSLTHVTLILTVESVFGVRFSSSEVAMLQNAGELDDLISLRLGNAP